MLMNAVFQRFAQSAPIALMVGGMLERVLTPEQLDALFARTAERQYTRELLFSTVFDLLSQVVCGLQPSMHAAYQAQVAEIGVSLTAVYNKLNGVEPAIAAAVVHYSAQVLGPLVHELEAAGPAWLPGYDLRIVDGTCLEATEHRVAEWRLLSSGALPGKSLVVYDPGWQMARAVVCCEDGHAQERSLFDQVLPLVEAPQVWMADRNFCTRDFLLGIAARGGYFLIREHANLAWYPRHQPRKVGRVETGEVWEQAIEVIDAQGGWHRARRIQLLLDEPTRDGELEINLVTNLPPEISALELARLYRRRWRIEQAFQELALHLNAEITTLGYPKAALFGFCLALVAYNILAVVKAALRAVHGTEKIDQEVSGYYLANEIANTYRGMRIALPPEQWEVFRHASVPQLATWLVQMARSVNLAVYRKHPRKPKKAPATRRKNKAPPHVSTARLLAQRKTTKRTP